MSTIHPRADLRCVGAITFFAFAARGLAIPFVGLYLKSLGFQGTEIGFLTSLSALIQLLIAPTLHTFADHMGQHRRLYYGLLATNVLGGISVVVMAANRFLLGGAVILREASDTQSASLLSQLTITSLEQQGKAIYGRVRAWGSLGWAMTTLVSGRIYAIGGYPLLFLLFSVCNLALMPLVRVLPERTANRQAYAGPLPPRPRAFYLLMISLFLFAIGNHAYGNFSFIYFREGLGASNELIGLISSVAALSEIPSMILIDRLLRRTNTRRTLIIGMMGQAVLWIGFTILTQATFLIPLMIFRGTFFTFFNVSTALLVSRISHPANAATNQAIAQVTIPGMAVVLAGTFNGWLFDNAGPHMLFLFAACMATLAAILLLFARSQIATQESRMQMLRQEVVDVIPLATAE